MTITNILSIAVVLFGGFAAYQMYTIQSRVEQLEVDLQHLMDALEKAIENASKN